jgi:hypothetical protein
VATWTRAAFCFCPDFSLQNLASPVTRQTSPPAFRRGWQSPCPSCERRFERPKQFRRQLKPSSEGSLAHFPLISRVRRRSCLNRSTDRAMQPLRRCISRCSMRLSAICSFVICFSKERIQALVFGLTVLAFRLTSITAPLHFRANFSPSRVIDPLLLKHQRFNLRSNCESEFKQKEYYEQTEGNISG